jgi:hypothetical protein
MMAPKSILRTSSFKTKVQPKFVDDELSMFSSVLSNFKPPFLRKKEPTSTPDCSKSKVSEERDDYPQFDQTEASNAELSDERLNMSVTFDDMHKDDISTGVTFDLDHKDPLPLGVSEEPMEKSLEITFENYVEYEALKRRRSNRVNIACDPYCSQDESTASIDSTAEKDNQNMESALKEELVSLRKLKEKVEQEKRMQELQAKLEEEMKQKAFMDKVKKEAELVEKLKQRVADVKEATRAKRAEVELKRARAELENNKAERIPVAPKIQERLRSTVDRLAAASTAQDLLELDVANIVARASNRHGKHVKSVMVPLSDHSKRILAPPPVKEKLTLPGNYKYNLDMDTDPFSYVERFEYDEISENESGSTCESNGMDILTRPGYVKPAPSSPLGVGGFF